MKQIISVILGIIGQWMKYRNLPEFRRARVGRKVDAEQKKHDGSVDSLRHAVRSKDKNYINKILRKFAIIFVLHVVVCCVGCITSEEVVYVPADREVQPMTNTTGVVGWFVSDTVFEELLIYRLRVQEMERQNKVENIMKEN